MTLHPESPSGKKCDTGTDKDCENGGNKSEIEEEGRKKVVETNE